MPSKERRKRHTLSIWEQRTSQLRRHIQISSKEALQNDELTALNPRASICCKTKQGEEANGEKVEGGNEEKQATEGNKDGDESPTHQNLREHWRQKSRHGNAENMEPNGTTPEQSIRRRQSQRRSRHKKVRTEGKETPSNPNSTSASQEGGLDIVTTEDGKTPKEEKRNGEAMEVRGTEEEPPSSCHRYCKDRYISLVFLQMYV